MSELSPTDPFVGQLLDGRYLIVRVIAFGGITTVYEATHVKIGRTVAIKVLRREMAGDPAVIERFTNEARAAGSFGHPNIVECTDFGELPGNLPYLVLEYLDGHTLGDAMASGGPMSVRRAVKIAMQVASALGAAHARGVIHRDLTSHNVFLTHTDSNPDHVKVLDFGISTFLSAPAAGRITRQGLTMGTPEFMAPEQIADPDSVGLRVDVYALGVILYQMLSGRLPFGPLPLQTLLTRIVGAQPPAIERDDVPEALRAIVIRALAKYPKDRFASMAELEAALAPLSTTLVSGFRFPTPPYGIVAPIVSAGPTSAIEPAPIVASTQARSAAPLPRAEPASVEVPATSIKPARPLRSVLIIALAAAVPVGLFLRNRSREVAPVAVETVAPAPAVPSSVRLEVSSRTPLARVTFRGRTYPLPLSQEVRPGGQQELVELTAPGREGKRFWPTLDHPLHLAADLVEGRGVVEATVDETMVALGEKAPAATRVPAPAKTPRPISAEHRPINRPRPAPVTVASTAVAAAPAAPASNSPGAVAPPTEAPPPAAPKPTVAAPVVAVSAPPPSANRPPASASVPTPGGPAAAVDPVKTRAMVRSHLREIQGCYERGKMDNPELKGRVTLRIAIGATGAVRSAEVETSSLGNARVEGCIADMVRGWTFPAPAGGDAVISYPFNLH